MCRVFMYLNMDEVTIHITHHLFMEIGRIQLEWVKKKKGSEKGKRIAVRKKQSIQFNSNHRPNFVNKALSNFDLEGWIDKLGIKHLEVFTAEMHYQKVYTKKNVE